MRNFFSGRKDDILKMSKKLKKYQLAILVIGGVSALIRQLFVFLLDGATKQVNAGNVVLGLAFFVIYLLQDVFVDFINLTTEKLSNKLDIVKEDEINKKTIKVLSKTRRKVIDARGTLSSANILEDTFGYIKCYYKIIISIINIVVQTVIFGISILGLVRISFEQVGNTWLFVFVICFGTLTTIFLSFKGLKESQVNYKKSDKIRQTLNDEKNDIQNVEPINSSHEQFMTGNFCNTRKKLMENDFEIFIKRSKNSFLETVVISGSIVVVVVIFLFSKDIKTFSSSDFLSLIAFSTIFSKVLFSIRGHIRTFSSLMYNREDLKSYEKTFEKVIAIYNREEKKHLKDVSENALVIPPFIHYFSNFSIENNKEIKIEKGGLTLLNGKSGAGKSTLIDLLIGEIGDIGYYISAIKYFKEGKLGSKTILDEITLGKKLDTDNLTDILRGVCLYENFSMKADKVNQDLISYMQNIYKTDLSTGLDQRVLLARVLYQLDETVDLLLFDEPIGNVDQETAMKIVEYIKDYCNCDKKRFIMLATHQHDWIKNMIDSVIDFNTVTEIKTVIS